MPQFIAKLIKPMDEKGAWTVIEIPAEISSQIGKGAYIKCKGQVENAAFAGIKIMSKGAGVYWMPIKESFRHQIGKGIDELVRVSIEKDETELFVPEDFIEALESNSEAREFFNTLTESGKKYYISWIEGAKQEKTRENRIQKSVEKLQRKEKFA